MGGLGRWTSFLKEPNAETVSQGETATVGTSVRTIAGSPLLLCFALTVFLFSRFLSDRFVESIDNSLWFESSRWKYGF